MSLIVIIGLATLLVAIILADNALITITIAVSVVIYLLRKMRIKTLVMVGVGLVTVAFLLMLGLGVFGPTVTAVNVSDKVLTTPFMFEKQMTYFRFDEYPDESLKKDDHSSVMFLVPYDDSMVKNLINHYPDIAITVVPPKERFTLLRLLSTDTPWYHFDQTHYMTVVVRNEKNIIMEVMLHDLPKQLQEEL